MALCRGIEDVKNRLFPVQQKSKIPVRVTRFNSDTGKSSSKDEESQRDSVDSLQNKRPSRIPIMFGRRRKSDTDENKLYQHLPAEIREKPLGKDSETPARMTQTTANPPTVAKRPKLASSEPVKELKPSSLPVRQSKPRTATPLETRQVPKKIEHTEVHEKEFGQLEKENSEVIEELQMWIDDGDQKNEALEQVLEKTNEENVNLLVQVSVMQKELRDLERKNDSLQTELETKRVDMKRLRENQYYMERELRNLKRDLKRKEQNLEELELNLNTALMEKQELLDDVDYLNSSLKNSQGANEQLNAQVDELNEMMKESNKGPYYRVHFCAEEKLLKGSLDLGAHPEELASEDALEKISLSRVIDQLEEQMAMFEEENARILSEKEKELNDMKYETARFIQELEDQLAKLTNQNYSMTAELSQKDKQLCDLRLQVENQNEFIQKKLNLAYCSLSERNLEIDRDGLMQELQHEKSNKDTLNIALELAVNNYVVNEKVHSTKTRELENELAKMKRLSREAQTYKVVYLSLCQRLAFLVNKNGFCSDASNKN